MGTTTSSDRADFAAHEKLDRRGASVPTIYKCILETWPDDSALGAGHVQICHEHLEANVRGSGEFKDGYVMPYTVFLS